MITWDCLHHHIIRKSLSQLDAERLQTPYISTPSTHHKPQFQDLYLLTDPRISDASL